MRFILTDQDPYTEVIMDTLDNTNVFFLASSGFGVHARTREIAKRVVEFLNKETTL